jgi:hypothetical protein
MTSRNYSQTEYALLYLILTTIKQGKDYSYIYFPTLWRKL